ncbi:hypothetical protein KE336_gp47 [Aeromonas phage 4_D05]|uniref:Uncharacterized protein n=2 Tax=Kunmingvirus TaxID=2948791 RepID=A0A4Y5TZ06_9CAUD|nr:hypothetical protein KE335_gp55 [Aeromonas phage 2_D05]YP_010053017.1 hypothetical protein KE336_gp47 [Aeromonas phage 4_D05]QDB73886.1 hypothetical protein 2D05_055 [Aeromonas phage 2_D05]QDJ96160.1 hypothetical protein 4D05_047 [Aeromonas phage 4_D05]
MKISNSKKELARIISENGGWRDGEFAAQDGDGGVGGYGVKPEWDSQAKYWWREALGEWFSVNKINNHHQAALSRAEYFHLYPAPDADGWIEWKGGACPVDGDSVIDVKLSDGDELFGVDADWDWQHGAGCNIIAYRLHKPEQAKPKYCESVMRSIPEPSDKPTIEQLAADYRNAKDYAERKQQEADDAKADAEAKLAELVAAGKAHGLVLSVADAPEPELVITDWRDLQVGDEIEVFDFECMYDSTARKNELMRGVCVVMSAMCGVVHIELKDNLPKAGKYWNATGLDACEFKFIRRP